MTNIFLGGNLIGSNVISTIHSLPASHWLHTCARFTYGRQQSSSSTGGDDLPFNWKKSTSVAGLKSPPHVVLMSSLSLCLMPSKLSNMSLTAFFDYLKLLPFMCKNVNSFESLFYLLEYKLFLTKFLFLLLTSKVYHCYIFMICLSN